MFSRPLQSIRGLAQRTYNSRSKGGIPWILGSSNNIRQAAPQQKRCFGSKEGNKEDFLEQEIPITVNDPEEGSYVENRTEKHSSLEFDASLYKDPVVIRVPEIGDDGGIKPSVKKWYKTVGDIVKPDDVLCDIETSLFTFSMVADDECDGIVGEIHALEGEELEDNDPICTVLHPKKKE